MKNFDSILKQLKLSQTISNQLGLSSQISEMLKAQKIILDSFSGGNMFKGIAKGLRHQAIFTQPAFATVNATTKSMGWHPNSGIQNPLLGVIDSINKQHQKLFGSFRSSADTIKWFQPVIPQINNLGFALSGISGQMAGIAARQNKWDFLEDYKQIAGEAVIINDKLVSDKGITKETLEEIKAFLQRIKIRVNKIDTDASAIFWKLITLLSFILAVLSEARNWEHKSDYVTKQEVETVIKERFLFIEKKLKEEKEFKTISRKCVVMLKPKNKTWIIDTLPKGFEVVVLQVHHKWIFVSYLSPSENLPQTGWILKKYLNRP